MKISHNNYVQLSKYEKEALSMYVAPIFNISLTDSLTSVTYYDIFGAEDDRITIRYKITLSSNSALDFENKLNVKLNNTTLNFKIILNKSNINASYFNFEINQYINDSNIELIKQLNRKMTFKCRQYNIFKYLYDVITDTDVCEYTYYFCEGENTIKFARADTSNPVAIKIEPKQYKLYDDLNMMIQDVYDKAYKTIGNSAIIDIYCKRRNLNNKGHIWYPIPVNTPLRDILESNYML